jgi:hypothetical protein
MPHFSFIWCLLFVINLIMVMVNVLRYQSVQNTSNRIWKLFNLYLNVIRDAKEFINENVTLLQGPEGSPGETGRSGINGINGTITGVTTTTQLYNAEVIETSTSDPVASGSWQLLKMGRTVVCQQIADIPTPAATSALFTSSPDLLIDYQQQNNTLFAFPLIITGTNNREIGNLTAATNLSWQYGGTPPSIAELLPASVTWISAT